jgi:hypothetical protein
MLRELQVIPGGNQRESFRDDRSIGRLILQLITNNERTERLPGVLRGKL